MRYIAVVAASFLLTTAIVLNAYYQKKQFYSTAIYLTNKQPCLANLVSQSWYAFFDMCLVFALFQDELGVEFVFLAAIFLIVRAFHWLLEERVDYMERTPVLNTLFHLRVLNAYFIKTVAWRPAGQGFSVHLAIGIEYFILIFNLFSTTVRYVLHSIDAMREDTWDRKTTYLLYLDIVVGLLRLLVYVDFAFIMWPIHPFPLFIARPIYLSVRALKKSIRDVIMSRRAIRYMNTVFGNATAEDLENSSDNVCIICREDMVLQAEGLSQNNSLSIKRLPCSHLFHVSCLRSWFQRQQTCPTCRMDVIRQARQEEILRQQPNRPSAVSSVANTNTTTSSTTSAQSRFSTLPPTTAVGSQNVAWMPPANMYPPFWPTMSINTSNMTTNPTSSHNPQTFPPMPILMPPFMGMPIVYPGNLFGSSNLPMPDPPSGLPESADAEHLRQSAEARCTTLRQINLLLNAALLQMNTYLLSVSSGTVNFPNEDQSNKNENLDVGNKDNDSGGRVKTKLEDSVVDLRTDSTNDQDDANKPFITEDVAEDSELVKIRKERLKNLCTGLTNDQNSRSTSASSLEANANEK